MKYLLDTNVISETWKPRPHPAVCEWLETHGEDCGVPAPVLAEIADGIYAESGARREVLIQKLPVFWRNGATTLLPGMQTRRSRGGNSSMAWS
jgi:predicted nucleic acid-binding protein